LVETLKALGSETRLRILRLLANKKLSAANVYREYVRNFHDRMHRESIYRALEKLVNAEILNKEYDEKEKEIVYGLRYKKLTIDLVNQRIYEEDSKNH